MSLQFSKKLCVRKEPERGCLAKVTSSAPKDSSPILHLPPEVRACIFNYIIDEANLIYQFSPDFTTTKCLARWPEYRKKLSFLKACKLFEAEALTLIQVKSVTFEVGPLPPTRVNKINKLLLNPLPSPTIWNVGPQEVPLPLGRIRPHLRDIRLDPTTLVKILETDILSTLPKLEAIRVQQKLLREPRGSEFRDKLEEPSQRRELLVQSHLQSFSCGPSRFDTEREASLTPQQHSRNNGTRNLKLSAILQRARLVTNLPIIVEVCIELNQQSWPGSQRIEPVYPVVRNVSEIRFVHGWPGKNLVSMEVEVWSQPMTMAFKSKAVETIVLTTDELNGVQNSGTADNPPVAQ